MTDHDIIFGVVNKLDKKQFIVIPFKNEINGETYIEVTNTEDDTEINFDFDKEGNLTNIWVTK